MRYLTLSDLEKVIPRATLIQLSNDDPEAAAPDGGVIGEIVGDAEEMVDAHLRGRYTLPLATVPPVLRQLAARLARHGLYARRPEGGIPDAVAADHKEGVRMLEAIRDGKLTLGLPTGEPAPEPGAVAVRAPRRRFDRETWEGYG